jgi:hypothetical protein
VTCCKTQARGVVEVKLNASIDVAALAGPVPRPRLVEKGTLCVVHPLTLAAASTAFPTAAAAFPTAAEAFPTAAAAFPTAAAASSAAAAALSAAAAVVLGAAAAPAGTEEDPSFSVLHARPGLFLQVGVHLKDIAYLNDGSASSVHPLVRTHPRTGEDALYLSGNFIDRVDGMGRDESRPLVDALIAHATSPIYTYRHRWRAGDLVMWDNAATMHYAVFDYAAGMARTMHRTTAAGDAPFRAR